MTCSCAAPNFFTTSAYAPRLRERLATEHQLIKDATERNWPREIERHTAMATRIIELLNQLDEPLPPAAPERATAT